METERDYLKTLTDCIQNSPSRATHNCKITGARIQHGNGSRELFIISVRLVSFALDKSKRAETIQLQNM